MGACIGPEIGVIDTVRYASVCVMMILRFYISGPGMMMNSIGHSFRQNECDKRLVCKYQCGLLDEIVSRTNKLRDTDAKLSSQILDFVSRPRERPYRRG